MEHKQFMKSMCFVGKFKYALLLSSVMLISTAIFYVKVDNIVREKIQQELENISNDLISRTEDKVRNIQTLLLASANFYEVHDDITEDDWNVFLSKNNFLYKYPGVVTVGLVESDYQIGTEDSQSYIIKFIEPLLGNEAVVGYDIGSDPDRALSFEEARDRNSFIVTSPVVLVQDVDNPEPAFVFYQPVYKKGSDTSTLQNRRDNVVGYISVATRAEAMFLDQNERDFSTKIDFQVKDSEFIEPFFVKGIEKDFNSDFVFRGNIETGSRGWVIDVYPNERFFKTFKNDILLPRIILFAGLSLAFLVFFLFSTEARSRQKAFKIAEDMTKKYKEEQDFILNQKKKLEQALAQAEESKRKEVERTKEAVKLNAVMMGREGRIVELKAKISELEERLEKEDK